MNFVFISPQFPHTYWNFCDRLRRNGVNVLGIGDTPYDALDWQVRSSLTEYYYVDTLEDYDKVFRAVALFSFKYGKIDWIESNNEYWLEQDARLRTDFNITSGAKLDEVERYKSKAEMKKYYKKAGVPTARQCKVTTRKPLDQFIKKVGFPVIVKPEVGVGAAETWKLTNAADVDRFFENKPDVPYVCEEFITGDIRSYDAVIGPDGEPLFESQTCWPPSIMDIVVEQLDLAYYVSADMPEALRQLGRATVKAFGVKNRFVHLEFFCLTEAKPGLGEVGDFVGLEVNMRPAGGYTPDMMDFAHSLDVYQIWADMVTTGTRVWPEPEQEYYCAYAGRRDQFEYVHTDEEVYEKYGSRIVMAERLPDMMVPQMGNRMFTVKLDSLKDTEEFIAFVEERA